jgi:hypothetical protein
MAAAYGISFLPPTTEMDIPKRCFYFANIYETKRLKSAMFEPTCKPCFYTRKACRIYGNNRVVP